MLRHLYEAFRTVFLVLSMVVLTMVVLKLQGIDEAIEEGIDDSLASYDFCEAPPALDSVF